MATTAPQASIEASAENLTIRLPADLAEILRSQAQEEGYSVSEFIAEALADWCGIRGLYPDFDEETIERFRRAVQEADGNPKPYVEAEQVFKRLRKKYGFADKLAAGTQ